MLIAASGEVDKVRSRVSSDWDLVNAVDVRSCTYQPHVTTHTHTQASRQHPACLLNSAMATLACTRQQLATIPVSCNCLWSLEHMLQPKM